MTDLKAANEALAKALAALDSPEHDADVREAEAIRNRLIELDARIGARITAKLEAHKAIASEWKPEVQSDLTQEAIDDRARYVGFVESLKIATPLADAWQAHHEEHTGKYAMAGDEIPERVLTNGVAEMQQAAVSDEH
jgi:hypothetical protein